MRRRRRGRFCLSTEFHHRTPDATPLFEAALGADWANQPKEWRAAHDLFDRQRLTGEAEVIRGTSPLAKLIAALFRFPKATPKTPVEVTMERQGETELWTRRFGPSTFRSRLSPAQPGHLHEAFGPFTFEMALPVRAGRMSMPVRRAWCCGIPIPRPLLPRSETEEFVQEGQFHFDARLTAPLAGWIVHYKGQLAPAKTGNAKPEA